MSNRRVDDELYGRPNRSGVLLAGGLMVVAMVVGIVVLQKVDKSPSVKNATGDTQVVATPDSGGGATDTSVDPSASTTTSVAVVQRDPALVKVIVTNGSGVNRAAKKVSDFIVPARYQMITPRDATAKNLADAVFFQPGFQPEAEAIAAQLGPVETIQADGSVTSALPVVAPVPATSSIKSPPAIPPFDVQVMVGPGLAKKYNSSVPLAGSTATTTTKAPA